MKVSVVIPAYNEEKFIKDCLKALTSQSHQPNEIIVVNNNSTDNTAAIANRFNVRVVSEVKQGMIFARNRGLNSAKYELIARVDADVRVPRDWVEKILTNFKDQNIDALTGPISYYDSSVIPKNPIISKMYIESTKVLGSGNRFLIGPNMIIKKSVWGKVKNKVNLDDSKVHEDVDLSLKIIKVGGKIGYDPTLVVKSSARRILGKPSSFFIEYPKRFVQTFIENGITKLF